MDKKCEICGKAFTTNVTKKRFCSKACGNIFTHNKYRKTGECADCHKPIIYRTDRKIEIHLCASCALKKSRAKIDQSGPKNPMWRGGHKYWQDGKCGKDKDGLSWRKQRQLAWERDKYTCQDCKKPHQEGKRKPDVHHIKPYRISHSHALDNLITLCQPCHKKRDAQETCLWNGVTFGHLKRKLLPPKPRCIDCDKTRKLNEHGRCFRCQRRNVDIPLAKELFKNGKGCTEISKIIKTSRITIYKWLIQNYAHKQ